MLDLEFIVRSINLLAKRGFTDAANVHLAETVARELNRVAGQVTTTDVIAAAHAVAISA